MESKRKRKRGINSPSTPSLILAPWKIRCGRGGNFITCLAKCLDCLYCLGSDKHCQAKSHIHLCSIAPPPRQSKLIMVRSQFTRGSQNYHMACQCFCIASNCFWQIVAIGFRKVPSCLGADASNEGNPMQFPDVAATLHLHRQMEQVA